MNNTEEKVKKTETPYDTDAMAKQLLDLVDNPQIVETWEFLLDQPTVKIHKNPDKPNCYRIQFDVDNTPETCFDLISDINRRVEWDDLCEYGKVVSNVEEFTNVIYVKMKPIWPVASRDAVLLSHYQRLKDGRLLNVTKSLDDSYYPEQDGVVRMEAGIAGQVVAKLKSGITRVVQIADGDLKGWIPQSVLKFVASNALPNSLKKLNSILQALPQSSVSYLLNETPVEEISIDNEVVELKQKLNHLERTVNDLRVQLIEPNRFLRLLHRFSPVLLGILTGLSMLSYLRRLIKRE